MPTSSSAHESVALAASERIPTVAIDETVGRRITRLHGLNVTGSLGILIQAKQMGAAVKMRTAIAGMRQHGIWLSEALGTLPDGLELKATWLNGDRMVGREQPHIVGCPSGRSGECQRLHGWLSVQGG